MNKQNSTPVRKRFIDEYLIQGNNNTLAQNDFANSFFAQISKLAGPIKDNTKVLSKCFCSTYGKSSDEPQDTLLQPMDELYEEVEAYFEGTMKAAKAHLLVGSKGVGKTSMLYYMAKCYSSSKDSDVLWLVVDLQHARIDEAWLEGEIITQCEDVFDAWIREGRIPDVFLDTQVLQEIFSSDLRRESYRKGDLSDSQLLEFIRKLLQRDYRRVFRRRFDCICKTYPVCLVLDNVDRARDTQSEATIFRVAKRLVRKIPCKLVVSLRRPTFHNHREEFRLQTCTGPTVLDPPSLKEILLLKIDYLFESGELKPVLKRDPTVIVKNPAEFTKVVIGSFEARIFSVLEKICVDDVREMLQFFVDGLCSGHLEHSRFYKICKEYVAERGVIDRNKLKFKLKTLGLHEFVEALMKPKSKIYLESESQHILNIFDNHNPRDPFNTVIRYRILTFVKNYGSPGVVHHELIEIFTNAGYYPRGVVQAIRVLFRFRLIRTELFSSLKRDSRLVITDAGKVYIEILIPTLMYTQVVQWSTYVDPQYYIGPTNIEQTSLEQRFQWSKRFVKFLEHEEEMEQLSISPEFLSQCVVGNPIAQKLREHHDTEFDYICQS